MAELSAGDPSATLIVFAGRRHELYPATANTIIANPTGLNVAISIARCTLLQSALLIVELSTLGLTGKV
jgi:hypothetical protein